MNWKAIGIWGAVLFLGGGLLGFVPQYKKVSQLTRELDSLRSESKLQEIRGLASLSYVDTARMNYGSAAEHAERMFDLSRQLASETKSDGLRSSLAGIASFHDTVMSKLRSADPSALEPLQQLVQKTQRELKP